MSFACQSLESLLTTLQAGYRANKPLAMRVDGRPGWRDLGAVLAHPEIMTQAREIKRLGPGLFCG